MKIFHIILVLFCPFLLQAQTETSAYRWNVTFHAGPYTGISHPMKNTMRDQGFMPHKGWFGNGGDLPMVQQDWGVQLGIEKIFKNSLSGKILFSDLQGEISGFSKQDGDLDMVHRMVSSALMAAYHSKQKITRVSVGPALHFSVWKGTGCISAPIRSKKPTQK